MSRPPRDQHRDKDEMKWVAAAVLIIAIILLIWYQARQALAWMMLGPDYVQLWLLDQIGLLDAVGREWMKFNLEVLMREIDVYHLEWGKHFVRSSEVVGNRTWMLLAAIMAGMIIYVIFGMKGEGFKRSFTLTGRSEQRVYRILGWNGMSSVCEKFDRCPRWHPFKWFIGFFKILRIVKAKKEWVKDAPDFASYQAKYWKVAIVGATFDPDAGDPSTAQSLTPPEWLRDHKVRLTTKDGLDEEAAGAAFVKQLGTQWNGVKNAPYYVQAICVMAALNRQWATDAIANIRDNLAIAHATKSPAEAEKIARKLLEPHLNDARLVKGIDKVCGRHYFTNTAVMRIYGWGGPFEEWGGGKGAEFAPAKVLWIKKLDRQLWYAIQAVGRRAFMVESAGTTSHFFHERIAGKPFSEPKMGPAIEGVKRYLAQNSITDLEQFFYVEHDFDP